MSPDNSVTHVSGLNQLGPLPPGNWLLRVTSESEGGESTTLFDTRVDLVPGETLRLQVDTEASVFNGSVSSLGRPVQAELTIRDPSTGFEITSTHSDEAGLFSALIPEEGIYDVSVRGIGDLAGGEVTHVPFEDPEEPILIELPNAEIEGVVLDAIGTPIAEATVTAQMGRGIKATPLSVVATTSPDGRFVLPRLSEGRWQLQAAQGDTRSDILKVELSEGEVAPGVVLRLTSGLKVQGRLVVAGQPVAGASLWTACLWLPLNARCGGHVETDESGRFLAAFGPVTQAVSINVILKERGLPWTPFKVHADPNAEEQELTLTAPSTGGSLQIILPAASAREVMRATSGLVLFHENGGFIPLGFGAPRPPTPGSALASIAFDALAPGNWHLHQLDDESNFVQFAARGGSAKGPLASVTILPGQSSTLDFAEAR